MPRRRQTDEIAFGSDSFLDIVANIVGILIILIVIAGVRVAQMPAVPPQLANVAAVPAADPPPVLAVVAPAPASPVDEPPQQPAPPPPEPLGPPPPIAPPPELLQRLASLRSELSRLEQTRETLSLELEDRQSQSRSAQQQLTAAQSDRQLEQQQIENGRRTVAALQTDLETCQRQIAGLHMELAELEALRPPEKQLRHRLTPLGKSVDGPERHFLLSKNRVAVVPVDELGLKLKEELLRKKSQLLRGRTRVGTVGPVQGFTMEYVVAREALSLGEELQMGTTVVRLAVSEWRMLPQPDAVFESADESLLPRSRFLEALRSAGFNATLTFWVYPDSFELHRQLRDFAHDNSFDVASRPLPEGIPIVGSNTNGSRSIAQ
jgi:hypothetical protein